MKAAIYARYSSDRQREQSITDQIDACKAYCEAHKWLVTGVYTDSAKTGRTAERDGLQAMLGDCSKFDVVVVWKRDRIARDRYVAAQIKHKLTKHNVKLEQVMETVPEGAEGIIMDSLLDGMAEWYSAQLAQNVLRGMTSNAKACKPNGVHIFGYDIVEDHYEINEYEARIVRRVFEIYAENINYNFNAEFGHIRGKKGGRWRTQQLSKIVRDIRYKGIYKWGDIMIEDGMPRIIDDDTFERAQLNLRNKKANIENYLLNGKLFYRSNGKAVRTNTTVRHGKRYSYYVIDGKYIPKDDLEDYIANEVMLAIDSQDARRSIAEAIIAEYTQIMNEDNLDDERKKKLNNARRKYNNLIHMAAERGYSEAICEQMDALEVEIESLEVERKKLPKVTRENIDAWLDDMQVQPTDKVLKAFVTRVEVENEMFYIQCAFAEISANVRDCPEWWTSGGNLRKCGNCIIHAFGFVVLAARRRE